MTRRWLAPDFFTDEKMKRATVPERLLAAAIIANQDDDGRLRGDPAYLRSIAFLYDDYPLDEVREMRDHLAKINPNIHVYQNDDDDYIQLKRYKRYQRPRYYHPSKFPAPTGWPFEEESNQRVTIQQPSSDLRVTKKQPSSKQEVALGEGKGKGLDLDKGKGIGRGIEHTPSPVSIALLEYFPKAFGRKPNSRELAYLRDIEKEISAAGATAEQVYEAYKEAAGQNKLHLSYVRAILDNWLGIERERGPP